MAPERSRVGSSLMAWYRRQIDTKTDRVYHVQRHIAAAAGEHVQNGTRDKEEQLRYIATTEITLVTTIFCATNT